MFAALLALAVLQAPPIHIEGVIVGADLRPVTGARVLVACQPEIPSLAPGREILADVQTGADGAFAFDLPEEWAARQAYKQAELIVYAPGHVLHTAEWSVMDLPVGRPVRIALAAASSDASARLRIVDETGAPVRNALVMPVTIRQRNDGERTQCARELWRGNEARTDNDGYVTLPMPRDALAAVRVEADRAPGLDFILPWDSKELFPEVLTLPAAQKWHIEFDGPAPAASVHTSLLMVGGELNPGLHLQAASFELPPEGGWLRCPNGRPDSVLSLVGRDSVALEYSVELGATPHTARFERSEETYVVRIPIVEAGSGAPVPGVELVVQAFQLFGVVRSDADGIASFRTAVRGGHVAYVRAPDGYLDASFPDGVSFGRPQAEKSVDLPAFALAREALVTGRTVDSNGRPVSGAWIVGRGIGAPKRVIWTLGSVEVLGCD